MTPKREGQAEGNLGELLPTAVGSEIVAGRDFMVLLSPGWWHRAEDDSWHDAAGLQDFHGHSGFSVVAP